jgi:hypothetical protein
MGFIEIMRELRDVIYPDVVAKHTAIMGANPAGLDGKVDKITGKGLSAEDYTTLEKNKLSIIDMSLVEMLEHKGFPNGYVPLDANGKINPQYISSLSIIDTYFPADQASMLALSQAGIGDIAFIPNIGNGGFDVFVLAAYPASTLANWKSMYLVGVTSINGQVGVVNLSSDDIPEGAVNQYFTNERVDDRVAALVQAGLNITLTYDDIAGTFTISGIDSYTKAQTDTNISAAISALVNASPATLDTLNELAAALGDDPAFATTITTLIGTKQATLVSGTNIKTVGGTSLLGAGDIAVVTAVSPALTGAPTINGIGIINFTKPSQGTPLFTKASVSTISIPIGTSVKAGVNIITVSGTAYTLSLNSVGVGALDTGVKAAGTDYYVYALEAGGFILSASSTNPTGYTTTNSRQIGGFHYGVIPEAFTAINNIVASDATKIAGINAYSFWDLKFRASNGNNRGMFKANSGRWFDIYLLNTNHHLNGTSSAGKVIAGGTVSNGRDFPKIPTFYGGNGTTTYGTLTWFEAAEIGKAYGKDMISYEEFCAIAYGVLEATSAGAADTGTTQHLANLTSKFGMCMATGCQFIWGKDLIGPVGAAWNTNTEGRGSIYNASLVAAVFGGRRDYTVESGSRSSNLGNYVWDTGWDVGCRYACDHLELA